MDKRLKFKDFLKEASSSTKLYKLDSIAPVRLWDYVVPTVTQAGRFTNRVAWTDSSSFTSQFYKNYPILKEIDLDGIAIGGGAVVDILLEKSPNDIDMFVILPNKMSEKEAEKFVQTRIQQFVKNIFDFMEGKNKDLKDIEDKKKLTNPNFKVERSGFYDTNQFSVQRFRNVFTLNIPSLSIPIQIIATPHASLSDLFNRMDLKCTAMAYFKGEVLFSELGKFSFENLAFVAEASHKDTHRMKRMVKYFDKGFDIIFPDLDISKVRKHNFQFKLSEMLDLPFLNIETTGCHDNKIEARSITCSQLCLLQNSDPEERSAMYPPRGGRSAPKVLGGIGIHKNISSLIHDKWQDFIYEGAGPSYKLAFLERPLITERMIINTYKTIESKIYSNGALNLSSLEKFFTVKKLSTIINDLVVQYVLNEEAKGEKAMIFDGKFEHHLKETIQELVKKQVELTKKKLMALQESEIHIIQQTVQDFGSPVQAQEWYGQYLLTESAQSTN